MSWFTALSLILRLAEQLECRHCNHQQKNAKCIEHINFFCTLARCIPGCTPGDAVATRSALQAALSSTAAPTAADAVISRHFLHSWLQKRKSQNLLNVTSSENSGIGKSGACTSYEFMTRDLVRTLASNKRLRRAWVYPSWRGKGRRREFIRYQQERRDEWLWTKIYR
jgi:hypothetical protein